MKRLAVIAVVLFSLTALTAFAAHAAAKDPAPKAPAAKPPANRVAVMYFHRTKRCPTCKKMGSYSEEAVKTAFAEQVKSGKVEFHYIDFQKPENAALTKAYKITGPALVVARVKGNKVECWKPLPKIWELVSKKDDFYKYVQQNVREYLGEKPNAKQAK